MIVTNLTNREYNIYGQSYDIGIQQFKNIF